MSKIMNAKRELFAVLNHEPLHVIHQLRQRVVEGRFKGRVYSDAWEDPCGCLYGTIAILHGCKTDLAAWTEVEKIATRAGTFPIARTDNVTRSPLENLVYNILSGDTPETNRRAATLLRWIDEYIGKREAEEARRAALRSH